MKLTLLFTLFLICVLQANTSLAQTKITLDIKDGAVESILDEIEAKTQFRFIYNTAVVDLKRKLSIKANDEPIESVLRKIFANTKTAYQITNNKILLVKKSNSNPGIQSNVTPSAVEVQQQISGKITDQTNQPLPGVTVLIKGTNRGTTTDLDGNYTITVSNPENVLIFSALGFSTQEITVGNQTTINISLKEAINELEVVTINAGYYKTTQRQATGSISKIDAKIIERQPIANPLQAMQGRIPGVYINQTTGTPGGNFQIRVRGTNSIANGNDPLYIIDGVPFISNSLSENAISGGLYHHATTSGNEAGTGGVSPLNSINPNDIEDIQVLRDGDATAIYGSRGANGVVLITTKKGKSGATKFNLGVKTGVSKVLPRLDLLNTKQYLEMRNEAVRNDGDAVPTSFEYDINGTWDQNRYTDWQDVFFGGTANMTDVNASISGGSDNTNFIVGGGYGNQGTVYPGSNKAERFSMHAAVSNTSPNKKFKTSFTGTYGVNKSDFVLRDLTGIALGLNPNAPALYDDNGNLNWENSTWSNPLAFLENRFNSRVNNLVSNLEVSYDIGYGLSVKTSLGLNDIRNEESAAEPATARDPADNQTSANSSLQMATATSRSWIIEPQLNWDKNIGKGKLSVLVGGSYQNRIDESSSNKYIGFPSDDLIFNPKSASTNNLISYNYSEYRYAALYGRINYNWNEKYIVNITGRRDGSSRFGSGKKFSNFGAIGLAWLFTNESFLNGANAERSRSILNFGKLRTSYGITGNDQIGDYRYLDTYGSGASYQNVSALSPSQLFNPEYGWETNTKFEAALELGLLNNRIFFTPAYYLNRSSNQLVNYKLPGTTGFPSILRNLPATVQNTGVELELTSVNIQTNSFKWSTAINVTFPKNELIDFPSLESSSYANDYIIGKPLNIYKTYHFLGVNSETGKYEFADMNGDGSITPDDRQSLNRYDQRYYGGINNSTSFKGFQIDVFFQVVSRHSVSASFWSLPGSFASGGVGFTGNLPSYLLTDRWRQAGDNVSVQYFSREISGEMSSLQDKYDASDARAMIINFIRLKNVSVSWQLPSAWLSGVSCLVYVQGQNLFTVTNYDGLDPETGSEILPPLTTVVAGINLTF